MSDRPGEPEHAEPQAASSDHSVIPAWSIWVGAGVLFVVASVSMVVLFGLFGAGTPADKIRLEIIKLAGSVVIGTGGAAALLLAARRQRSTELGIVQTERDLAYKEQAAADARHDAIERRATELYTAAAEQLASDKAPVRLAGLYALERFGQANVEYRQTVVNLLCAYLRMPFTHPDFQKESTENEDVACEEPAQQALLVEFGPTMAAATGIALDGTETQRQELQVRLTAQRILADHLRPNLPNDSGNPRFWRGMDLDLSGAVLHNFDISRCHVTAARFVGAYFVGEALFHKTDIEDEAWFSNTHFENRASFNGTRFPLMAWFDHARFEGEAWFQGALFQVCAIFDEAWFKRRSWFDQAHFEEDALFIKTHFEGRAQFDNAWFEGEACFDEARFGEASFRMARVCCDIDRSDDKWPNGWTAVPPENDEAGRIKCLDGIWGFVVKESGDSEVGSSTD